MKHYAANAKDAAAEAAPPPVIRPGVSRVPVAVQVDFALEPQ